ncbi:fructokinase/branched chain amino acid--2-keto-4-methylthiobutyrate aminotransferase, partial [Streptococcus pasteurianus]
MILQGFKLFLLLRYRFLLCIILSIKLVIEGEKMTKLYGSVEAGGTKFVCA